MFFLASKQVFKGLKDKAAGYVTFTYVSTDGNIKQRLSSPKSNELQISNDKNSVINDHCCHQATKIAVNVTYFLFKCVCGLWNLIVLVSDHSLYFDFYINYI